MKLELRGITKRFGPLVANDHIDLVVEPGQIHALLGENGAGKSTLMNVLYGLYQAEEGEIRIDGEVVNFKNPSDAVAAGIGMVHQHFMLVPVFTVAQSVALGFEPVKGAKRIGMLDLNAAREKVREMSVRFGFDIDPDARIEDLPVGAQQRVEIIKALFRDAKILILDEPTAVLTPQETDELIEIMRGLKQQGTAIVFITHKLREIRAVADAITVIRRGKIVAEASPQDDEASLAAAMVGRTVDLGVKKEAVRPQAKTVFEVSDLSVIGDNAKLAVDHLNFSVRSGEILAIAGVQGNGQTELCQAILGLEHLAGGTLVLDGADLARLNVKQRLRSGIGYVPEDRSVDGMIASLSIAENMFLDVYDRPPVAHGISLKPKEISRKAAQLQQEFDVRLTSIHDPISTLSGGNAQKAILARELSRPLKLLVASQPTRGLDVGSIEFVHRRIVQQRDAGTAVVLVSTELDEVYALADRIAVMYRGRIMAVVPPTVGAEDLGLLMAGVMPENLTQYSPGGAG